VLLASTCFTLALTGGLFWEGLAVRFERLSDFADPVLLLDTLRAGVPYASWVVAILGAHEMGHYLACRYYGIPATLPYFFPAPPIFVGSFGAVIRIRGRIPHRKALFDVAAAGPIAGFVIAFPVMIVGILTAEPASTVPAEPGTMWLGSPVFWSLLEYWSGSESSAQVNSLIGAGWVGMLVTSLNLFPVGQLDGGHAAYAISRRLHRWLTRLSIAGLVAMMLYQGWTMRQTPAYAVWCAILLWMRDRHPRLIDETTPLGRGRRLLAVLLLLMFVLSFMPVPIIVHDG